LCDGYISLSIGEAYYGYTFFCSFPMSPASGVSVAPLCPQPHAPHMLLRQACCMLLICSCLWQLHNSTMDPSWSHT
jgi:hypothetical protein